MRKDDIERNAQTLSFKNPKLERLFRVRNIRKALDQTRFGYILGLILFSGFAFLDLVIAPHSFFLSAIVRLVFAPILIGVSLYLSYANKSRLEFWSVMVLVFTQVSHIALVTFGSYPPLYFSVVTSIVIIFSLIFSTLRFRDAIIFLLANLPVSIAVCVFALRLSPGDLLFSLYILVSFSTLGVLASYSREYYVRADFLQSDELGKEKKKSDELLLNILPQRIARELKATGTTRPVSYDGVTVLFADFVGFTRQTAGIGAEPIISTLDRYFSYFDYITKKYKLEKIKTIGDAYMLAGGLDSDIPTHAVDCVLAAFDFLDYVQRDEAESGESLKFDLRVGVHTGPVIAGVLGSLKFSYDIFGSTVNMASRMEKYSEPNRINASRNTFELVKEFFDCESRGIVEVKNGEQYEMFFIRGIKPELCLDPDLNIPNGEFVKLYNKLSEGTSS